MGYRSEVALALDAPATSALSALAKIEPEVKELLDEATDSRTGENESRYYWESIKWYESYAEIRLIKAFLAMLPDDSYGIIRMGEELDDIEQDGVPYDFELYVERRVCF